MGLIGKIWWRKKIGFDPTAVLNGRKGEIKRLQGLVIYDVLEGAGAKGDLAHVDLAIAWAPDGRRILFECRVESPSEQGWLAADDIVDVFDRTASLPDIFELEEVDDSAWRVPLPAESDAAEIAGVGAVTVTASRIQRRVTEGTHAPSMPELGWYAKAWPADEDEDSKTPWWILLADDGAPVMAFRGLKLNKI